MKRKYAIIVNPVAGRGRTAKRLSLLKEITEKEDAIFDYYVTERPMHATLIADSIFKDYDAVVAYGGDGTANEVMNGLVGTSTPFGVIPDGTGNDFAKSLNITRDLNRSIQILLNYKIKVVDLGVVGDRVFLNGVGVGFDGYVTYRSRQVKKLKGTLAYLYTIISSLITWRAVPVSIEIDGKNVGKVFVFLIAIGNGWSIGGGLRLTPKALIYDSIFDICQIEKISINKAIYNLMRLKNGTHVAMKEVSMRRGRNIVIKSDYPLPVHFDGEIYDYKAKKVDISIVPQSALVIGGWT